MDIRELVQQVQDAWNAKDQETFLTFYDPEIEIVAPGFSGKGLQGVRDFWALWNEAFPDNRTATRTSVVEGSTMAQSATFQGTHTGPLMSADGTDIPPTGRQLNTMYAAFTTVSDDRIVRTSFFFDQMELLDQLGLLPAPGAAG